jgi:hypothetical protein
MKKFVILFSIIFLFMGSPLYAYFMDGNELVGAIKEYENKGSSSLETLFKSGIYGGFIVGLHNVLDEGRFICTDRAIRGQILAVVAKFLNDNPARWNEPAVPLVTEALKKAFLCKK